MTGSYPKAEILTGPERRRRSTEERRHDGKIAVAQSNLRWCSDGFDIACDNAEKVRVAFALDCCDREVMGVATTEGIKVTVVEQRFGQVNHRCLPGGTDILAKLPPYGVARATTVIAAPFTATRAP